MQLSSGRRRATTIFPQKKWQVSKVWDQPTEALWVCSRNIYPENGELTKLYPVGGKTWYNVNTGPQPSHRSDPATLHLTNLVPQGRWTLGNVTDGLETIMPLVAKWMWNGGVNRTFQSLAHENVLFRREVQYLKGGDHRGAVLLTSPRKELLENPAWNQAKLFFS